MRLIKIGEATIYRRLKKEAYGKIGKDGSFIRKIDPKLLKEYKHPDHTLAEMIRI